MEYIFVVHALMASEHLLLSPSVFIPSLAQAKKVILFLFLLIFTRVLLF